MLDIRVEKTTRSPRKSPTDETKLGFGQIFTDHMADRGLVLGRGLARRAHRPLRLSDSMHPASTCLHYGSEIFEGLKAYRRADGGVQLFRPWR